MPLNPFATSHIEDYLHGEEPWAVVTGSTDGIGKATAKQLLSKGFNVLIHGRTPSKASALVDTLQALFPSQRVASVIADFSQPTPENISAIPNYIREHNLRVTLFVNNVASTDNMLYLFTDVPPGVTDKYLNIGIVVFTKLCQEVVPLMKEERLGGRAMMVNLGSAAAELPTPYLALYAGTKGYMLSFTRTLACEALMTSSTLTFLYVDVHAVSTAGNSTPESIVVPSADKFARSLLFEIGRRKHQGKDGRGGRGGAHVIVTPYWGHGLERMMLAVIPASTIEQFAVKRTNETKAMLEEKYKRTE